MLVHHLQIVSYHILFSDDLSMTPYRWPPHERPGSSGYASLVADTTQSDRFTRSLVSRFQAGQIHLHTCICPLKSLSRRGGAERACTLVAGTQDLALAVAGVEFTQKWSSSCTSLYVQRGVSTHMAAIYVSIFV